MRRPEKQEGVALLTVLLLTATLAVVAIGMTEIMTRALGRAAAGEARDQAYWALHGIEAAAIGYLEEQGTRLDGPGAPLFEEPLELTLGEGIARIAFAERSNCFNVNGLVAQGDDGLVKNEAAAERFANLIVALGGSRSAGQQLAGRIIDFMDADRRAEPGGAEDYDYARRAIPYRTGSVFLTSVSELRAISGFSRDVYRSLAPYLCTLPSDGPQALNVNTLTPAQAPLLLAITGDALNLSLAERLIEERTDLHYDDVQEFLDHPLLQGADLPPDVSTFLATTSDLVAMELVLESGVGRLRQESLVRRDGGSIEVLERRVGERLP